MKCENIAVKMAWKITKLLNITCHVIGTNSLRHIIDSALLNLHRTHKF